MFAEKHFVAQDPGNNGQGTLQRGAVVTRPQQGLLFCPGVWLNTLVHAAEYRLVVHRQNLIIELCVSFTVCQGQIAEHILALNGGYCVYYPLNIFRNTRHFENWGYPRISSSFQSRDALALRASLILVGRL